MPRVFLPLLIAVLLPATLPANGASCPDCIAQNIFDEEATEPAETTPKKAVKAAADDEEERPAAKPRKKKRARKKKKAPATAESSAGSDYSPAELAKQSYAWAPETDALQLKTTAPGIKAPEAGEKPKAAADAQKSEAIESRPAPQGFKLPQIPVTQVLIVAGFVILFLIYRFRVGRQLKRRKY